MSAFHVTITTVCEMVVEVEAKTEADAKRQARAGDYEPMSHWNPLDYGRLRAVYVEPAEGPLASQGESE